MKNKEFPSVSDVLNEFGISQDQLTDQTATVRAMQQMSPCFRFNIEPKEAFLMLYRLYQEEVQGRYLDFCNDAYTQEVVAKVIKHLTKPHPESGIMLCGVPGNGKTTLAKAILRMARILNSQGAFSYMGEYFRFETRFITATEVCEYYKNQDHWRLLKSVNAKLLNSVFMLVTRFSGLQTLSHFSNDYIGVGALKLGSPIFHECRTIHFQPDC